MALVISTQTHTNMATPIILKLDVTKLKKEWFFKGAKGIYCDLVIYENDRESPYGDTHVAKQSPSREARDAGEKAHIVANGKWMPQKGGGQPIKTCVANRRPSLLKARELIPGSPSANTVNFPSAPLHRSLPSKIEV